MYKLGQNINSICPCEVTQLSVPAICEQTKALPPDDAMSDNVLNWTNSAPGPVLAVSMPASDVSMRLPAALSVNVVASGDPTLSKTRLPPSAPSLAPPVT